MRNQAERDRVELRVVETKLREMTKDRDEQKEKFISTFEKLNQVETELIEERYRHDELLRNFNLLELKNERITMKNEDYRSILFNSENKFKKLAEWEKELRILEKEVRAIKKRDNPYEYVDFADKHIQTWNPIKNKGMNTDPMIFESYVKSQNPKQNIRSSLADTVTSWLGGIAVGTDTMTDAEMITPKEHAMTMKPKNSMHYK